MRARFLPYSIVLIAGLLASCTNNPYRAGETAEKTCFASFSTEPTKLDPAVAYYVHEAQIIDQIYEPPFTYHYLKRPYEMIPLTAEAIPAPVHYGKDGKVLEDADPPADQVGSVSYTVRLKKNTLYKAHPCFAKDASGRPYYKDVSPEAISDYAWPFDFPVQGTRELLAKDYALEIRRLADPRLASPVYSTMERFILGMKELHDAYAAMLEEERAKRKALAGPSYNQERDELERPIRLDYMEPDFPGVTVPDSHTFTITITCKYPQILYWMCMHFFCPMPQEALDFYDEPAVAARQFTINRCPVGTGAYYLQEFKPNEVMVLQRNPSFHEESYPSEGAPGDAEKGLLADSGKRLPFIDRQVYCFEKEAVPAWNKFLQGYYDASGIGSDVFDQAIAMKVGEGPDVSELMRARGISLATDVDTMFWYTAFNMRDDVVGGPDPKRCKLRQAISIALDYNEYLDIFANGRGVIAQGPLPPGIFGYRTGEAGTNPFTDRWNPARGRHERKSIEEARKLMEEAGYPGGMGSDGKPLTLHYDHSAQGDSFFRSYFDWVSQKLAQIGVRIEDEGTDLSRYRQKKDKGNWQVASGGWLADYPDPENFLFLFYGPNGQVEFGGANMVNFKHDEYDALFKRMESMQNTPARQEIIDRMMLILQEQAPAVWQYHPVSYGLQHKWYTNVKPHQMIQDVMKYRRLDPVMRVEKQVEWNNPVWWPVSVVLGAILLAMVPAMMGAGGRNHGAKRNNP